MTSKWAAFKALQHWWTFTFGGCWMQQATANHCWKLNSKTRCVFISTKVVVVVCLYIKPQVYYCPRVVCLQLCHQNYVSRGEFHCGGLNTTREGTFTVYTLISHLLQLCCHSRCSVEKWLTIGIIIYSFLPSWYKNVKVFFCFLVFTVFLQSGFWYRHLLWIVFSPEALTL